MAFNWDVLVARPVGPSLLFLILNVVALYLILRSNRKKQKSGPRAADSPVFSFDAQDKLSASDVLGWEFEYARTTASEAMAERHNAVNFYLLATGVVISGVVAVLSQAPALPAAGQPPVPAAIGTVLLWLLCFIGWVYFLAIIRLRQAWRESATVMNQIKDFYIHHASHFSAEVLSTAFRWKSASLPPAEKKWTVHFYSAMLIALLNSAAYIVGGLLLASEAPYAFDAWHLVLLPLLGVLFFAFHVWLYSAFLKPAQSDTSQSEPKHPKD
jgi:preprotein translocase subunit YajC